MIAIKNNKNRRMTRLRASYATRIDKKYVPEMGSLKQSLWAVLIAASFTATNVSELTGIKINKKIKNFNALNVGGTTL